ncbi:MAG: hypothetical protein EOM03_16945 [Clostridia bacterium]|nr:hypothetical protein [Clostridia bacterium]
MVKMAWEEPEEAFKLFVQSYNARQRLAKKAKADKAPVTVNQKARMVENNIQAENATLNITTKTVKNIRQPKPGTIESNQLLWQEIENAHHAVVSARLAVNSKLKNPYGMVWGQVKNHFGVGKGTTAPEWIKAQKEERASEILRFLGSLYDKTKEGRWRKGFSTKPSMTKTECKIKRRELLKDYGWSDEQFYDFLEICTGKRSTKGMPVETEMRILAMLEQKMESEDSI